MHRFSLNLHWLVGLALTASLSLEANGQAGVWVFDGWPQDKNGYFAGQTEVLVDGARVRVTEWPQDEEDLSLTLVTYHLGTRVVKIFPWNGERVALVFEADAPLPAPQHDEAGKLLPPAPFPALGQEGELPCGDGCIYHIRNASFTALDQAILSPGGVMADAFVPDPALELLTQQEFMNRHNLTPDQLELWGSANRP
jgi:hypothetical protein